MRLAYDLLADAALQQTDAENISKILFRIYKSTVTLSYSVQVCKNH